MREPSWLLLMVVVVVGCGDNRVAPRPLVEDPAVQRGCQPGPVVGTRAKRVACREELIEGRLAAGRLGDFVLENARVRVVIRGPGEGYYLHGSSGGGIVDAAVGGEDLVKEILPIVDLSAGAFEELVITEAGDDGPAELVVRGPMAGLDLVSATLSRIPPDVIVEHHYRLPAGADAVELETRVFAGPSDDGTAHELYDGLFMGGRAPVFVPGHGFAMGQGAADLIAGEARTYVYVGSDDATLVDPTAVVAAIRARHVVVGTGAFVTAGIVTAAGTSLPGDTVDLVDATVALHVRVQAAAWQPLAQVRIYQGTQQIRTIALDPLDTAPVRFDQTITVPAPVADTFWVVRVDPAGPGDPVLDRPLPAFTNPLFGRLP